MPSEVSRRYFRRHFYWQRGQEGGNGQMPQTAEDGNPYLIKRRNLCDLSISSSVI
ncbi:hypothetical protein [Neisseria cinerea]|uniref:hypothetical protein n=1 Tax=Neisseria cinerea TaxID=483 RepID=UPI0028D316F4|nr:hypothetical protein [Neisseria cinerea]